MEQTARKSAFPEVLVLFNPFARYYYKTKFHDTVAVRMTRHSKGYCGNVFTWTLSCDSLQAAVLRRASVTANGPESALDAARVSLMLDGDPIVGRLPIRKAEKLGSEDFSVNDRHSLFRALTTEMKYFGPFMPHGTRVDLRLEGVEEGKIDVMVDLDMAIYAGTKGADGIAEQYDLPKEGEDIVPTQD